MKKTLEQIVDDLKTYIEENESPLRVEIKGEKTNIIIEREEQEQKHDKSHSFG